MEIQYVTEPRPYLHKISDLHDNKNHYRSLISSTETHSTFPAAVMETGI